YENIEIVTRSLPDMFLNALRQKQKTQTKVHAVNEDLLKVTEKCPECGHMATYLKNAQLQNTDEGLTIFYTICDDHLLLMTLD
ncbi:hypothetical protein FKP32DRAFT_1582969, partial [Trametes sanguinea]